MVLFASIEGMRALAVLVVLLFHLDVPWFKGGFLGVDLFFVISGFIITRNIQFDLHAGKFTLREFYLRRFRRLFPALLVTVMATLLVSLAVLTPLEMEKTARSAIFALISLANFNFWLEAGYFDAAAHTKPLLHTWSLSVEEQFYLFWPALLVFLATNGRRCGACLWPTNGFARCFCAVAQRVCRRGVLPAAISCPPIDGGSLVGVVVFAPARGLGGVGGPVGCGRFPVQLHNLR